MIISSWQWQGRLQRYCFWHGQSTHLRRAGLIFFNELWDRFKTFWVIANLVFMIYGCRIQNGGEGRRWCGPNLNITYSKVHNRLIVFSPFLGGRMHFEEKWRQTIGERKSIFHCKLSNPCTAIQNSTACGETIRNFGLFRPPMWK